MDVNAGQATVHDRRARRTRPLDRDLTDCPPAALEGVIDLLSAPGGVNLEEATIALQSLDIDEADLAGAVETRSDNYVRTLIYRDENCELLALTWAPGQRSLVHDHGHSTSVMRVVSGVATEHLYRRREHGAPKREFLKRTLRPGVVTLTPGHTLHSLANAGEDVLVTLHLYAPPLEAHDHG